MNSVLQELKNEQPAHSGPQSTLEGFKKEDEEKKNMGKETSQEKDTQQETGEEFGEEDEIIVYADDRENRVAKELSKMDITVQTKRLEVADFLVSDRTAVERKKAEDFVDSVLDSRLFDQLNELTQFEKPVLLVEGKDLYSHRNVHPNAIRGALATVALDYGIPIIWSEDEKETSEVLKSLAKREQEDNEREVAVRGERTPKSEKDLQKFLVAGLPGINTKIAERLLEEFNTVQKIFTVSEDELKEVEGIGEKKAERIRELLKRGYN